MIVRILRVVVFRDKIEAFRTFLLETAIPLMRSQPGLVSVTPCLPRPENPLEFCLVMIWDSVKSLKAFAGTDWREPHVHPDEEGVVRERFLHHYNLAKT